MDNSQHPTEIMLLESDLSEFGSEIYPGVRDVNITHGNNNLGSFGLLLGIALLFLFTSVGIFIIVVSVLALIFEWFCDPAKPRTAQTKPGAN